MYRYACLALTLGLMACANNGPNTLPGYYQPAQAQSPYISAGFMDDMGNYHPPTQVSGGVMYGRWYRPQPGHQVDITPQEIHARRNPYASNYTEVANMSSDGDVGTAY
jgi:hypothetical protein